jgi:tetratricopeptide (TPR) repeat protein
VCQRGAPKGAELRAVERYRAVDLMEMAITAEQDGDYAQALIYYDRAIEIDPDNSNAWLGKGRATGWQSTLGEVRIREALVAFGHGIATTSESEIFAAAAATQNEVLTMCNVVYEMAWKHFLLHNAFTHERQRYLKTSYEISDVLEEIVIWNPANRAALDQKVLIAKHLLDFGVKADVAVVMQDRLASANTAIADRDLSYRAPILATETVTQFSSNTANINAFGYFAVFALSVIAVIIAVAFKLY